MGNREKKFKVGMTKEVLSDFMLHHVYGSLMGIFSIIFSIGLIIFAIVMYIGGKMTFTYLMCMIFIAVALAFSTPFQIKNDAKRELRKNPLYTETTTYTVSDRGVSVMQKGKKKFFTWNQILKVRITKKAVGFYYDKQYALVMPRELFEAQGLMEFVQTNMPEKAIKQR